MSKNGLNPQDVANALIHGYRFIAMDDGVNWHSFRERPIEYGEGFADIDSMQLHIDINFDSNWRNSIYEKQEIFEDGENILWFNDNIRVWNTGRYYGSNRIYDVRQSTGSERVTLPSFKVSKIIKFNPDLLGQKVQNED